jgi:pterin-4a-carbinolamine dehydratase
MDFAFKLPFRDTALPVQVEKSTWMHVDNERAIIKTYDFEGFREFHTFVSQVLNRLRKARHDADINIRGLTITIKLSTSVIEDVTESDLEIARFCDELREDVRYYYGEKRAI